MASPAEWVRAAAIGINLGNVLDAPLEGKWAPPAQQRYFSDYKKAGFKSVRVPVRWDQHTSKAPPYLIDTTFLDRVEQVIDWSLGQNLSTIVNTHHDDWLDGAANETAFDVQLDRLVSIWTQVATRLSSKDQRLLAFEVYNEPHLNMNVAWLNKMNARVLPAMRATNPTRNVFFGGLKWMNPSWIVSNPNALVFPPHDHHIALEVHSYDPYNFCGSNKQQPLAPSWDADKVDDWVRKLSNWSSPRGVSILLGEFACNKTQANHSGRIAWYQHVREAVRAHGWAMTVWDDGGNFGIYDRRTYAWDEEVLRALGVRGGRRGGGAGQ